MPEQGIWRTSMRHHERVRSVELVIKSDLARLHREARKTDAAERRHIDHAIAHCRRRLAVMKSAGARGRRRVPRIVRHVRATAVRTTRPRARTRRTRRTRLKPGIGDEPAPRRRSPLVAGGAS